MSAEPESPKAGKTTAPPRARRLPHSALVLLGVTLLLPTLSLVPLGSLWLWQKGYVLYWAIAVFIVVTLAFVALRRLLAPLTTTQATSEHVEDVPRAIWDARQEAAWKDVLNLGRTANTERLSGRDELLGLGLETITLVANRMHPERSDPLLRFTLPEAFAVIEQASAGLRTFAEESLPFGDRITVAQMIWVYRWRKAIPFVEKGYDLWRLIRLVNPLSAATQELRERYTRQVYDIGREHIARRLTEAFVREVGKAAIDLYGRSHRLRGNKLAAHVSDASQRDAGAIDGVAAEPLRILVAGQSGSGKSALVNALTGTLDAAVDVVPATGQQMAHRLTRDGLSGALLIDTPGVDVTRDSAKPFLEAAGDCDMLIWVVSAARPARAPDKRALELLRDAFAEEGRIAPPVLVALTHIDRLRPFNEWAPPLDLAEPASEKARSIRAAMDATSSDLALQPSQIIAVRADAPAYNIDALWASILKALPEAKRSRLQRCLRGASQDWNWRTVLSQAANAGRVLSKTVLQSGGEPRR